MSYKLYSEQQLAKQQIDILIDNVVKNNTCISLAALELEITNKYPVTEKFVLQRIELHCNNNHNLIVKGGDVCVRE